MTSKTPSGSLKRQFDLVAVYDVEDEKDIRLTHYIHVAETLRQGEREGFFMSDILQAIDPGYKSRTDIMPLKVLEGTHPSGLRMTAIKAEWEGLPTYMPVLEDRLTGKLLVVGPRAIAGADSWSEITYVNAESGNRNNAVRKIDDFLIEAARFRGERGMLNPDSAQHLVEDLIKAVCVMGSVRGHSGPVAIPAASTIGQFLFEVAGGKPTMAAYKLAGNKV